MRTVPLAWALLVCAVAGMSVVNLATVEATFTGQTEASGNQVTAAASFTLAAPAGVSAPSGWESGVPLAWNSLDDADEYQVRYRADGATEWFETEWETGAQASIAGLVNNEVYEFSVRGRNALRTGEWGPASPLTAMPRQWAQMSTAGGEDPEDDWSAPSASDEHTCAVTVSGRAYCWGDNRYGQLGVDADTDHIPTPTPVDTTTGLTDTNVVDITVGWHHSCALTGDGQVWCWGRNNSGQLGDGSTGSSAIPTAVDTNATFAQISANGWHTCAVTTAGAAYCWGWNAGATIGDGTTTQRNAPTAVSTGTGLTDTNVDSVLAGDEHTCALTVDGQAYCWGSNAFGQVGDGTTTWRLTPTAVATTTGLSPTNVAQLSAGGRHTCAVTDAGRAYCWGARWNGQLGDGTQHTDEGLTTPTPVLTDSGLTATNVASVSAGTHHTCALTTDGAAYCWGRNLRNHLGVDDDGLSVLSPTPVITDGTDLTGTNVGSLASGYKYTCAMTTAGRVSCWGRNDSGQLGDGSTGRRDVPTSMIAATAVPIRAPQDLNASATDFPTSLRVSHSSVEGADQYQVRRRLQGSTNWTTSSWFQGTIRNISNLEAGETYEFSVRARNDHVTTDWAPEPPVTGTPGS